MDNTAHFVVYLGSTLKVYKCLHETFFPQYQIVALDIFFKYQCSSLFYLFVKMYVSWLRIRTSLNSRECITAVEQVTCIVPETAPVQKIQVLVVEIPQGDFLLLLEAGKQCMT